MGTSRVACTARMSRVASALGSPHRRASKVSMLNRLSMRRGYVAGGSMTPGIKPSYL